jgi:hypothetical protein
LRLKTDRLERELEGAGVVHHRPRLAVD